MELDLANTYTQVLLQSATGIAKCDNFITKYDRYYKVRQYTQNTQHKLGVAFSYLERNDTCSPSTCINY